MTQIAVCRKQQPAPPIKSLSDFNYFRLRGGDANPQGRINPLSLSLVSILEGEFDQTALSLRRLNVNQQQRISCGPLSPRRWLLALRTPSSRPPALGCVIFRTTPQFIAYQNANPTYHSYCEEPGDLIPQGATRTMTFVRLIYYIPAARHLSQNFAAPRAHPNKSASVKTRVHPNRESERG